MTIYPEHEQPHWSAAILLAVLLQSVALGFWAGQISQRVADLTSQLSALRLEVAAHINARSNDEPNHR